MKKTILIISAFLCLSGIAQNTTQTFCFVNGQITANYIDNLGNAKQLYITDTLTVNQIFRTIQYRVDTIAKTVAKVYTVQFLTTGTTLLGNPDPTKGVFTISGEHYRQKTLKVSDLTGSDATLAANFFALVRSSTGSNLESADAPFHTGKLTINGVEMDSEPIDNGSGGILTQIEAMCLRLFNSGR